MELTLAQVILLMAILALGLVLGVLFFIYYMGMHNNTIDGNSFRLINPISLFDSSQFNEKGNQFRVKFLKLWFALVPFSFIAIMVLGSDA